MTRPPPTPPLSPTPPPSPSPPPPPPPLPNPPSPRHSQHQFLCRPSRSHIEQFGLVRRIFAFTRHLPHSCDGHDRELQPLAGVHCHHFDGVGQWIEVT